MARYDGLAAGTLSRAAAAQWATTCDHRVATFRESRDPGLWREAFLTLEAANTAGHDLFSIDQHSQPPHHELLEVLGLTVDDVEWRSELYFEGVKGETK